MSESILLAHSNEWMFKQGPDCLGRKHVCLIRHFLTITFRRFPYLVQFLFDDSSIPHCPCHFPGPNGGCYSLIMVSVGSQN